MSYVTDILFGLMIVFLFSNMLKTSTKFDLKHKLGKDWLLPTFYPFLIMMTCY